MSVITKAEPTLTFHDSDAAEIGELYRTGKLSLVDSINRFIEAGQRLKAKKDSLPYGEWLPWLRANVDVLGMNVTSTPQRLMKLAADSAYTRNLDEAGALAISRELWGNSDSDTPDDRNNTADNTDLDSLLRDEVAPPVIKEIRAEKVAASDRKGRRLKRRLKQFEHAIWIVHMTCENAVDIEIPDNVTAEIRKASKKKMAEAKTFLSKLEQRLSGGSVADEVPAVEMPSGPVEYPELPACLQRRLQ